MSPSCQTSESRYLSNKTFDEIAVGDCASLTQSALCC